MGFDERDPRPLIQPKKATTKVNFAIVLGVLLFFLIAAAGILWMTRHHSP